jgi:predicted NBD/HSP70 family sugar kinase
VSTAARRVLAIDVGGTKVQAAVVDAGGALTDRLAVPADWSDAGAAMVGQIVALARDAARASGDLSAVGVAATGVFSPEGVVAGARPGRERWRGTNLPRLVQEAVGLPCRAGNDSQLLTLGECRFGSGRGGRVVLGVSLGTGLGGGVVADGHLLRGGHGGAGEIGHVCVDMGGRACNCGRRGCVEAYVAGPAVADRYAEATGLVLSPEAICARAEAGETAAAALLDRVVAELGAALASVAAVVDPDVVVVGGGLGMRLRPRLGEVAAAIRQSRLAAGRSQVVAAGLGVAAPLYGAAALALDAVGGTAD